MFTLLQGPTSFESKISGRDIVYDSIFCLIANQYCFLAGITALYYDHILTFAEELQHVWKWKPTFVDILFLLNRYSLFVGYISYSLFIFAPPNDARCLNFGWVPVFLSCLTESVIIVLLVIRCNALYSGNHSILVGMSLLGLATFTMAVWTGTREHTTELDFLLPGHPTCFIHGMKSFQPYKIYWSLSLTFDLLVFLLTIWKTYDLWKWNKINNAGLKLPRLLMHDGIIYFVGLTVANIANLAAFLHVEVCTIGELNTGNNSVISHAISSILISRMVLNLRTLDAPQSNRTLLSNIVINENSNISASTRSDAPTDPNLPERQVVDISQQEGMN